MFLRVRPLTRTTEGASLSWGYGMTSRTSRTSRLSVRSCARVLWAVTVLGGCATGAESEGANPLFGDGGRPGPVDDPTDGTTGGDGSVCDTECKLSDGASSSGSPPGSSGGETPGCEDGATEACYSGGEDTRMVGACADGMRTCVDGAWGECEGEILPSDERCNGVDDDCNGTPDDGELGGGSCSTGEPGVCSEGIEACVDGSLACEATTMPSDEICGNDLDDDCNGTADDGCSTCAHDECTAGGALTSGCSDCATTVCNADAWCCTLGWDQTCVNQVQNLCGLTC